MRDQMSSSIVVVGHRVLRYGLALVIAWIGGTKFTAYEAQVIAPPVAKSPFLGWEPCLGGFPSLSGAAGQFLLKDVVLHGAAIWSLGESLSEQ